MTPDPPDTPATAELDQIRERFETVTAIPLEALPLKPEQAAAFAALVMDIPSLVAAVEAVLKPHQPGAVAIFGHLCKHHENHRYFSIDRTEADGVRACPDCTATVLTTCTGCGAGSSIDACPVREAITTALSGKEAGDGD